MLKVHGVTPSPFVRKVLLSLEYKGLDYEVVPVMPGSDDAAFRAISPLGKIPVLEDDGNYINDSSVICRYLDAKYPEKALFPADPVAEAKVGWLEEFSDSVLVAALAGLFQQRLMFPKLLGQPTDEAVCEKILTEQLPPLLNYLEGIATDSEFLVGDSLSLADISVVTCFVQGRYGQFELSDEHSKLKAYINHHLANPTLNKLLEAEKALLGG